MSTVNICNSYYESKKDFLKQYQYPFAFVVFMQYFNFLNYLLREDIKWKTINGWNIWMLKC